MFGLPRMTKWEEMLTRLDELSRMGVDFDGEILLAPEAFWDFVNTMGYRPDTEQGYARRPVIHFQRFYIMPGIGVRRHYRYRFTP